MTPAVLDACVLYPAALRDLWMHLAVRFVFQPKWTARIQEAHITIAHIWCEMIDEWTKNDL